MADFGFDFSESESATTNSGSSEEAGEVEQFVQPSSEIIYIPDHYVPIDQIEFLRPAEKIRQYGKAKVLTHRVYITRHLDSILPRITRQSTFNSVLPILNKLVTDNDTAVREAFAKGLKRLLLAYGEIKSSHIPLTKSTDSLPSLVEQMRLESVSSPQPSATSQVYTTYLPAHFLTSLVLPLLMDSTPSVQREAKEQLLSAVSEEPSGELAKLVAEWISELITLDTDQAMQYVKRGNSDSQNSTGGSLNSSIPNAPPKSPKFINHTQAYQSNQTSSSAQVSTLPATDPHLLQPPYSSSSQHSSRRPSVTSVPPTPSYYEEMTNGLIFILNSENEEEKVLRESSSSSFSSLYSSSGSDSSTKSSGSVVKSGSNLSRQNSWDEIGSLSGSINGLRNEGKGESIRSVVERKVEEIVRICLELVYECHIFFDNALVAKFIPVIEKHSFSENLKIKKEAAKAWIVGEKCTPSVIESTILPVLSTLSNDSMWNVRRSVADIIPAILPKLSEQKQNTWGLDVISKLLGDVSKSVKDGMYHGLAKCIVVYAWQWHNKNNVVSDKATTSQDMVGSVPIKARNEVDVIDSNVNIGEKGRAMFELVSDSEDGYSSDDGENSEIDDLSSPPSESEDDDDDSDTGEDILFYFPGHPQFGKSMPCLTSDSVDYSHGVNSSSTSRQTLSNANSQSSSNDTATLTIFATLPPLYSVQPPPPPSSPTVPHILVSHFTLSQLRWKDSDKTLKAAYHLPGIIYTLGKSYWNDLRGLYLTLAHDEALDVKRPLVKSLPIVAKILGQDVVDGELKGCVDFWLTDHDEIQSALLPRLPYFLALLPPVLQSQYFHIPLDYVNSSNWRIRKTLASSIHLWYHLMPVSQACGLWNEVVRRLMEDRVEEVRKAMKRSLRLLYQLLRHREEVKTEESGTAEGGTEKESQEISTLVPNLTPASSLPNCAAPLSGVLSPSSIISDQSITPTNSTPTPTSSLPQSSNINTPDTPSSSGLTPTPTQTGQKLIPAEYPFPPVSLTPSSQSDAHSPSTTVNTNTPTATPTLPNVTIPTSASPSLTPISALFTLLTNLADSTTFRPRLAYTTYIHDLLTYIAPYHFLEFVLPSLAKLSTDPVIDVRLGVAKIVKKGVTKIEWLWGVDGFGFVNESQRLGHEISSRDRSQKEEYEKGMEMWMKIIQTVRSDNDARVRMMLNVA